MSFYRVYEIDNLYVGELNIQQSITSTYPSAGTVLYTNGTGGTFWSTAGGGASGSNYFSLSTGTITLSSIAFIDSATTCTLLMMVSSGILYLDGSTIQGGGDVYNFYSSIQSVSTFGTTNIYGASSNVTTSGTTNFYDAPSTVITTGTTNIYGSPSNVNTVGTTNIYTPVPGFLSTFTLSTGNLFASSINLIDGTTRSTGFISLSSGVLKYNNSNLIPSIANLVSTSYLTTQLGSTVIGLGTAGYISTLPSLVNLVSTANLVNLVSTANLVNLVSTANFANLISTANLANLVSTANLANLVSTANLTDLISTANLANLVSTANLANLVSTANLANVVSTANLTDLISTANLANLVSTANLANLVSTTNLANLVSTANLADLISTANLADLVSTANLVDLVSTANLANFVSTANLADLISTANLADLVSTANLVNLVSTSYFDTQLTSTMIGLGTAGYVSTSQLTSTTAGTFSFISSFFSTAFQFSPNYYFGTTLYLNYSVPVGLYSALEQNTVTASQQSVYIEIPKNTADSNIGTFQTDFSLPVFIPSGIWDLNLFIVADSVRTFTYYSIYFRDQVGTETLIGTSESIAIPTQITQVTLSVVVNYTIIPANTSIVIKIFVHNNDTNDAYRSVTAYYQDLYYSHIHTTFGTIIEQTLITSSLIGLGTMGYLSTVVFGSIVSTANLANLVSTSYLDTQLGSTVVGLGTAGYLSSIPTLGGFVSTANLANLVSTNALNTALTSTVIGLGTAGYLSSAIASLPAGLVSTANLANLVSTAYLQTQIGSTVLGLGTAGYISSSQLLSTSKGIQNTLDSIGILSTTQAYSYSTGVLFTSSVNFYDPRYSNSARMNVSAGILLLNGISVSGVTGGGTGVTQIIAGANISVDQGTGVVTITGPDLNNYVSTSYAADKIGSTVVGLGTAGYISTAQFLSTTFSYSRAFTTLSANISTLFFSSATANTAYISSLTIDQLTFGDGNGWADFGAIRAAVVSSYQVNTGIVYAPIISTQQIIGINFLTQANLTSTVIGLGTTGYLSSAITNLGGFGLVSTANLSGHVSTANLVNLVSTANLAGHVSTANLANLVSTANLAGHVSTANLVNLVSTSYLTTQLGSTVIGLGTAGYLSSIPSLGGFVSTANLAGHVSTANLANLVSTSLLNTALTSTVIGLGTAGYLSSAITNLGGFGLVSTANLAGHVSTANLAGLISSANITSTVIGLGTAGYISSAQLLSTTYGYSQNFITLNASVSSLRFSTATGGNAYISTLTIDQLIFGDGNGWADFAVLRAVAISTLQINTGIIYATTVSTSQLIGVDFLSQASLTSTVIGLGTVGYLSSASGSINASGLVSTANLANLVSTTYLQTQLGSTVRGLGTAGYISSIPSLGGFVSTANLANLVSTTYLATQLGSTVIGLGTTGYLSSIPSLGGFVSTANLANLVSTTYLATQLGSTVIGLGTTGYLSSIPSLGGFVSTANLANLVSTANLANHVSTANLANLVSTTYLATQLGSTLIGLGTAGYISSGQLLSTSVGLSQYISSFIDPIELTSTVIGLGTQGFVSSLGLTFAVASTAQGLGTFGYTSTSQLLSTSLGLYQEIQNSPGNIKQSNVTSTIIGLGTFGYLSTIVFGSIVSTANLSGHVSTANLANLVSTANLANLVSTANLANLVSTANLANHVSTANLANLVSTSYLTTQLGSTVIGLGTAGYISSQQLLSSFSGLSNVAVTKLIAGTGVSLSPASGVGNVTVTVQGVTTSIGNYGQNTVGAQIVVTTQGPFPFTIVSATITTGGNPVQIIATGDANNVTASTWCLLQLYRGTTAVGGQVQAESSAANENIPFGITWVDAVPAGTYTYSLKANNVAGGSFQFGEATSPVISMVEIAGASPGFLSSISLFSTVAGLGTAGYLSSPSLYSTMAGLGTLGYLSSIPSLGGFVSTANLANLVSTSFLNTSLTSTVIGLGTAGYLSSIPTLGGFVSTANLANLVSTSFLNTSLTSTVRGLGTAGYLSSIPSLGGFVSTANIANLVSTSYLASQLGSTVIGLGTSGYISTSQLLSTSLGLYQQINSISTTTTIAPSDYVVQGSLSSSQTINTGVDTQVGFLTTPTGSINPNYDPQNWWNPITSTLVPNVAGYYLVNYQVWWNTPTTTGQTQQVNIQIRKTPTVTGPSLAIAQTFFPSTTTTGTSQSLTAIVQLNGTSEGLFFTAYNGNPTNTILRDGTYFNATLILSGNVNYTANFISTPTLNNALTSTVIGLGTVGYLSSIPSLGAFGLVSTANLANLVSSANLANLVSTANLAGHVSTANLANLVSTANLANLVSTANLANLVSTSYLNTALTSTVIGLGTAGYLSSALTNIGGFGLVSTANLANLVSTSYLNTSLTSTVIGLGTAGFISSAQFLSTTNSYSRAFRTLSANISTLFFSSATGNTAYISSLTIDQLTFGDGNGWADFGAIRAAVVSSYQVNTGILYAPIISTSLIVGVSFLTQANLTSTVIGLGTVGYLSSALTNIGGFGLVSTANLARLVSTANLANLVSTANLANLVSTANLATLVSTSYLQTQLGSTVIGLGTVGYLSTQISSFLTLSTGNLITSSITFNSPNSAPVGNNVFVSSSLFFFNQFVIGGTRVQQPQIFTF